MFEWFSRETKEHYEEIKGKIDTFANKSIFQAKIISEPVEVVWDKTVAIDSDINLHSFEYTTPTITAFKIRAISADPISSSQTPDGGRALPINLDPRKVDMHMTIPWVSSNNDPAPGLQIGDIVEIRYENENFTKAHATGLIKKTENPGVILPWSTDASLVDQFMAAAEAATDWGTEAFTAAAAWPSYDINMAAESANVNIANVIDPAQMSGFLTGWESKYNEPGKASTDMMKEYLKILDSAAAAMQTEVRITSMRRSDYDQARIMFSNYIRESGGSAAAGRSYLLSLYSNFPNMEQIIPQYEALMLSGVTSPDTTNMTPVTAIIAGSWPRRGHLSGDALDAVPWSAEVSAVFAATQQVATVSVLDEKNHFHIAVKSLTPTEGQTISSFQGSVAPSAENSTEDEPTGEPSTVPSTP